MKTPMNVVKIGSACHFSRDGGLNVGLIHNRLRDIKSRSDIAFLVVSGAIAFGKSAAGDERNNQDISSIELQSYASRGQVTLVNTYQSILGDANCAQLLLTQEDLEHPNHIRDLLQYNQNKGILTIVNYNDGVDFQELHKDNDTLAATLTRLYDADRLIILGKYKGFEQDGRVVSELNEITQEHYDQCKVFNGTGGFEAKLKAAESLLALGKETLIGDATEPLEYTLSGKVKRTVIRPYPSK